MFKRGFKSQCERRAIELRRQMGRAANARLSAAEVATYCNVTVWSPDNIASIPKDDIQHLLGAGSEEWSGLTLKLGSQHLIVVNTAQSARRQNSVIMHELAHILLGHELVTGVYTGSGYFVPHTFNQDQEDEAAWLGGTLLLPRPALLWMRKRRMSDEEAATFFRVSPDLLKWRVRMTGIDYQLSNATRKD